MNHSAKIKVFVDVCMTGALLVAMAYLLAGEEAHEWIGTALFVLFILHHILNRRWYQNIFRGVYSPVRILQILINLFMLFVILALMVSGIILSRYVFEFLPITGFTAFARMLHMLAAYWGFVFMSLHLGLHWGTILGMMRKVSKKKKTSKATQWTLRAIAFLIASYGVFAFIKHNLLSYMLLQNQFVFFDMEQPLLLFFLDYIAMMGLWIWLGYYIKLVLQKYPEKRKR